LLGVKSAIAAGGILPKAARAASVPLAAPARNESVEDDDASKAGVIGKLRGLFGGKR
jgi:hypothetical protein